MDEGTWESGRPPSRVSSQANLSLFDEEILFDDDPNRAYFNYMVGIDNQDDSLVGISTLEEMRDRHQPSKDVQQIWMNMAESKGTLDYPGPNTLEEGSLPNTIEDGSLPTNLESAVPRDDMEKAIMKRFAGAVNVPNVIFCASGKSKQEKLTAPGAFDYQPRPHRSFMCKNKRKVVLGLSLFFLGMFILVVALVFMGSSGDDDTKGASSTVQGAGQIDAGEQVPSASPSTIPMQVETTPVPTITNSPTSSPVQNAAPADFTLTAAPSATSTESPTATVSPTVSPTVSQTVSQTATSVPGVSVSSNLKDLIAFLSNLWPAGRSALSDSSSPQFRAAQWLSEEPNFGSYSDRQKRQRYTLATLFFATTGDQWTKSDGWLTTENECNWYSTKVGICNSDVFQILDLESNNLQGRLPSELALLADTLGESYGE
jgi:hypothetical protein